MNVWKVRHEGSPVASADLTFDQVMQSLVDGKIGVEDEVKGPADAAWLKIEDHPAFAEVAAELEPPPQPAHEDESNLDMNPLIDVALVLLIFFILTASYTQLQKIIEAAEAEALAKTGGVKVVSQAEARETAVLVKAKFNEGKTTILVQDEAVPLDDLANVLKRHARDPNRRTLLLDHDRQVPHWVVVKIQDDAKSAKMERVQLVVPNQ